MVCPGNTVKKIEGTGSAQVPVPLETSYQYNARNRLEKVYLPDGRVASYRYDPFGRRVSKQVGNDATYFVYADEGLVGEYDASGTAQKVYGWKPDGLWGTDPLYLVEGGSYYFYHNDHLGTPQRLTDGSGNVAWNAGFAAFGEAMVAPTSTIENNLRFPGQYFDAETGGYYNWHRYFDPASGRYTQVDPIGFEAGDENFYRYVQNNPLSNQDNFGLSTVSIGVNLGAAGGAFGGGGGTSINIGYSKENGITASITDSVGGGGVTGVGGGLFGTILITNASSVSQLLGNSVDASRSFGPATVGGVVGSGYQGVTIGAGIGGKNINIVPGINAGIISNTSAIIQYSNNGIQIIEDGTGTGIHFDFVNGSADGECP